jgi:hypothetical protein
MLDLTTATITMSIPVQKHTDDVTHRDQLPPPSYVISPPSLLSIASLFPNSGREDLHMANSEWGVYHHNDEDYNRDPEGCKHRDLCTFAERSGRSLKLRCIRWS